MNKRIWNFVFVAAAVATGIVLSLKPWRVYTEQRMLADQKLAEMKSAETSRSSLMEQKVRLESATGREELARNQGYVKPGERLLDMD